MSRVHDAVAAMLAAELERRGSDWDEPPALYTIRKEGATFRLVDLGLPEALWDNDATGVRTADILAIVADRLSHIGPAVRRQLPDHAAGIYGVAFRMEGWAVSQERDTPGAAAMRADARAHRLADRLDALEMRVFMAVDRSRATYMVQQARGEMNAAKVVVHGAADVAGSIAEALDVILAAFTGAPPVKRPPALTGRGPWLPGGRNHGPRGRAHPPTPDKAAAPPGHPA